MLQIPWLFLDSLPLLGMVFMLVVNLFNLLQEAMLTFGCVVMVVIEQFLLLQKWRLGSVARFWIVNKLWHPMKLLGLYLLKFELCCLLLQGSVAADNGGECCRC